MGYSRKNFKLIRDRFSAKRRAALDLSESRTSALIAEHPELKELNDSILSVGFRIFDAASDGSARGKQKLAEIEREYDENIVYRREFLKTYGGFMIHCGLTAMGNPSPEDTHVIHGELPCAPYRNAALLCGEDAGGRYVTVTGEYEFKIGFENAYRFRPECKLYEDGTVIHMTSNIENLRNFPMEYLYLCHINFRPVDGSRLVYSAKKENVYTHVLVPDNMNPEDKAKLEAYFEMLRKDVTCHENVGAEGQFYQPEIVFTVRYEQDEDGRGYCLQRLPDGYAHYVSHRPSQLPYGLRWISRMGEEDAMGMLLPATAEHNGYLDCKAKGYIRHLPARGAVRFDFEAGLLCPESAQKVADKIESMLK